MAGNLKARLGRIRSQVNAEGYHPAVPRSVLNHPGADKIPERENPFPPPWVVLDPLVRFRSQIVPLQNEALQNLAAVSPEFLEILFRNKGIAPKSLSPQDLLFFDLETTGLSGGAGTVAFLAAFGEPVEQGLLIRQYLLLDYPGEAVFLQCIEQELNRKSTAILVSYNGRAFDAQILRNRFAMQGRSLPERSHMDLLYISRLLWSGLVPSCSLGTLEAQVLHMKREGDIPGALAPQIWFAFLREGPRGQALEELLGVCDHNMLDIQGLAELLNHVSQIGADPLGILGRSTFNLDRLALAWPEGEERRRFLEEAALRGYGRAIYELARLVRRRGDWEAYRQLLEELVSETVVQVRIPPVLGQPPVSQKPVSVRASRTLRLRANINLASYYEWKEADLCRAEACAMRACDLFEALRAEQFTRGLRGAAPSIKLKLDQRLLRIRAKQRGAW